MYSRINLFAKYLSYYFNASNGKGHGMHSPFVYDFITKILNDKKAYPEYGEIESVRKQMLKDNNVVHFEDFGAGGSAKISSRRKISSITKNSAKSAKLAQLIFRMVKYYQPKNILELGTSLGLTTSYLAAAPPSTKVYTLEGAAAVAHYAQKNFEKLSLKNIEIIEGNIDNTLPLLLKKLPVIDLLFADANHRYEPTLRYFNMILEKAGNESIFIFDDIHWSAEMEKAWEEIKNNQTVTVSIDLFFIGILFFRKEIREKQHFVIRF